MIKDYILNFWVWWYLVNSRDVLGGLYRYWMYLLGRLNVVPMLSNLFTPLYQDYSAIGRFMSFLIRISWGTGGLVIFLIAGIPIIALGIIYLILPFAVIFQIVRFFL
jgi:hypothetical protein